ncbi:capsular biosynthesis protein [Thermococcus chitonophagus]|uniref:Capsular biosynthesis protein n=1 Tax=Thermococcus chitonophagus TaxID=54262 RepID=A0A160VR80_9EURY|nr:oligosaccharide flippase family protein [Thermococcus chitonophagus]ASJ16054.1 capsular biosynthesis protein [Thermococcus chitonophagus]CUX77302.1 Capsular polysaccharide biosynthesis protein [Thermococcus chitonophagus]
MRRGAAAFINTLLHHDVYKDVAIMTGAVMVSNVLNYFYQLFAGRFLTPSQYGELFSLLSLLYIFSVFSQTINTSVTKFTTRYSTTGDYGKVKGLIIGFTKHVLILGIVIYISILLASPWILNFLKIDNSLYLVVLFASLPLSFLLPVYQGVLRGLQRFISLGLSVVSWSFIKFVGGIGLIIFGYGVLGGIFGILLANVGALIITLAFLKDILGWKSEKVDVPEILSYGTFTFLVLLAYTVMWNLDVIMAKHYFSPTVAGEYSALSVLGKIILFAPGAVGMVIFPKAAERFENGGDHFKILVRGLGIVLLISGGAVVAYALFPSFIIRLIYGAKYLSISGYLWLYGLGMMFLSMVNVLFNYLLSIRKSWLTLLALILGVAVEIAGISYTRTFIGIIRAVILASAVAFAVLILDAWGLRHEGVSADASV